MQVRIMMVSFLFQKSFREYPDSVTVRRFSPAGRMSEYSFIRAVSLPVLCAVFCIYFPLFCCGRMNCHTGILSGVSLSMTDEPLSRTGFLFRDQAVRIADYILSLQCSNGAVRDYPDADTVNTDSNMEYALIGLGAAYQLTADARYLSGMKKGISWLASEECMSDSRWNGSWWYCYNVSGRHIACDDGAGVRDVRGVDTTSALFVYLLYLDHRLDPDSVLAEQYRDNAVSAIDFIQKNCLDFDHLSRSSWQMNSAGAWSVYDCKYSADQGDVYLGFHAAGLLFDSPEYESQAEFIRECTEKTLFDKTLGRYCTSIEDGSLDRQLNSFDPIQSQGFLPWAFGDDAAGRLSVSWLSGKVQPDGSISCYSKDPEYALSIAMLGLGENAVFGPQPVSSYRWAGTHLLDPGTGGLHDSLEGSEEDCNVAGLYITALSKMLPF